MADLLPDHDAWFTVSDTGPVRVGDAVHRQHFGLGLFVHHSLTRVGSREPHVHGSYTNHRAAWPHSDRPRAAQVARVGDATGRSVVLGHLHGLRDVAGKGDTAARPGQGAGRTARVGA